jgi:hypothetical protein
MQKQMPATADSVFDVTVGGRFAGSREKPCNNGFSTSPVPEVTIKGRSEPASTAPRGEYILPKFRCAACGRVRDIASEAGGSLSVRAG